MASTFSFIGIYLSIEVFDLVENPEILAVIKDHLRQHTTTACYSTLQMMPLS